MSKRIHTCIDSGRRYFNHFLCDFDRASSLIYGNKMPTRCNRGFYCSSYCLLNMFRAPLCPSSGAQEYYTVVVACSIWCYKDVKSNTRNLILRTQILPNLQITFLHLYSTKYHRQQPLYNTLELLMMGIVVPETC